MSNRTKKFKGYNLIVDDKYYIQLENIGYREETGVLCTYNIFKQTNGKIKFVKFVPPHTLDENIIENIEKEVKKYIDDLFLKVSQSELGTKYNKK